MPENNLEASAGRPYTPPQRPMPQTPNQLGVEFDLFARQRGIDPVWAHQQLINKLGTKPRPIPFMPSSPRDLLDDLGVLPMPNATPRLPPGVFDDIFPEKHRPASRFRKDANVNDELRDSLSALSSKQREALILSQSGLNQSEIGRKLGISQVAARKRLLAAQGKLNAA